MRRFHFEIPEFSHELPSEWIILSFFSIKVDRITWWSGVLHKPSREPTYRSTNGLMPTWPSRNDNPLFSPTLDMEGRRIFIQRRQKILKRIMISAHSLNLLHLDGVAEPLMSKRDYILSNSRSFFTDHGKITVVALSRLTLIVRGNLSIDNAYVGYATLP